MSSKLNKMTTTKKTIIDSAAKHGVTALYSGTDKTFYISGEDKKVKSFIRIRNLMGKVNSISLKQAK